MTYIVLHADRLATVLTDDPVVPAAEMPRITDAVTLFAQAGRLHADARAAIDEARAAGHAEGLVVGRAEALAAGEAETRAELFRLAIRDGEERVRRQAEVAALAIEVVRRIAGEIGAPAMVAGLAERATAALAPDSVVTIRVAPDAVAAVAARLAAHPEWTVAGDATLGPVDCVVETPLGRTRAGLDTQLAQIEKAWADATHG